jgi:hypothetical protein
MTIKLELYKAYKTRGGWKRVCVDTKADFGYYFLLYCPYTQDLCSYTSDGKYSLDGLPCDFDIISEWQEPVTHTVWLSIAPDDRVFMSTHTPVWANAKAIKKVTITEGEFDHE